MPGEGNDRPRTVTCREGAACAFVLPYHHVSSHVPIGADARGVPAPETRMRTIAPARDLGLVRVVVVRRSNLKATACCIVGCLTAWLILPACQGLAAGSPIPIALAIAESAFAQANPAAPRDRQEVEQLLREARQAMSRGDWASAEQLITRAEGLPVKVDPLYERFQDTPAKARRTLQELRSARSRDERTRPSERFSPTVREQVAAGAPPPGAGSNPRQRRFAAAGNADR